MPQLVAEDGIWSRLRDPEAVGRFREGPALFLDRDGVIVE